jgi:probable HAF family extracellular repeat protein
MSYLHRLILSLALGLSPSAILAAPPSYTLDAISVGQNAGNQVYATSINDSGQIAVSVDGPSPYEGIPLRVEPDGSITQCQPYLAHAGVVLNDGRLICYYADSTGFAGYAVGTPTSSTTLTYPTGFPITGMAANAATADGTIVGGASGYVVTWSGPSLTPNVLGRIEGQNTTALAVSRNGTYLAGVTGDWPNTTPFVYANGAFTTITLPSYLVGAEATGVNNDGTVIGYGIDEENNLRRGFIWRDGVLSWLNPLDAFVYSDPESINDNGLIVGQGSPNAMLWDTDGTAYLLDDLCNAAAMEDGVGYAYSINDSNQIIGAGGGNAYPGQTVPFLLNPIAVPEPTSAAILLTAFPLLAARRRK